ncbi:MAG: hypothetical protein JNK47_12645 [Mesorhizobium sp.]|nr:hypothetical protein [Mesorhizobium sp.]MBL8578069.1 hypothetical protein [Mesorhizobium sp.]
MTGLLAKALGEHDALAKAKADVVPLATGLGNTMGNRDDLSKPPSDERLLREIILNALEGYTPGSSVTLSELLTLVRPQLPDEVSHDVIVAQIMQAVIIRGLFLEMD